MSRMEQENRAVALRYFEEVRNNRNFDAIDELFTPDHAHHRAVSPDERGIEARRRSVAHWNAAFPDLRYVVDDVIAAGDKVVVRYTAGSTHSDRFLEIAPRGRPYRGDLGRDKRFGADPAGRCHRDAVAGGPAERLCADDALRTVRRCALSPTRWRSD